MEKLTQQIAGVYIGAQVEITKYSGDTIFGAIKSVSNDRIWITHKPKQGYPYLTQDWAAYDQCRLILTPLSAISDEDAVEVARIMGIKEGNVIAKVKIYLTEGEFYWCDMGDKDGRNTATHIIDYLRSDKRPDGTPKPVYDLGYMGIRSLIDAGIAISSLDKTETK